MEQDQWSTVKSVMLQFIEMQAAARQPRTQAVRALANDIEIVIDSSEAREKGMDVQTSLIEPETRLAGVVGDSTAIEFDPALEL